jgi:hypothetical protein
MVSTSRSTSRPTAIPIRKFWGGNTPTASWLSRDSIEQCFRHFGYELTGHEDNRHHAGVPCIITTASRKLAPT